VPGILCPNTKPNERLHSCIFSPVTRTRTLTLRTLNVRRAQTPIPIPIQARIPRPRPYSYHTHPGVASQAKAHAKTQGCSSKPVMLLDSLSLNGAAKEHRPTICAHAMTSIGQGRDDFLEGSEKGLACIKLVRELPSGAEMAGPDGIWVCGVGYRSSRLAGMALKLARKGGAEDRFGAVAFFPLRCGGRRR
jgi:hypothetical protein